MATCHKSITNIFKKLGEVHHFHRTVLPITAIPCDIIQHFSYLSELADTEYNTLFDRDSSGLDRQLGEHNIQEQEVTLISNSAHKHDKADTLKLGDCQQ